MVSVNDRAMAAHAIAAPNVWLDGDDWSWPGSRREPIDLGPPPWVPTVPLRSVVNREPDMSLSLLAATAGMSPPPAGWVPAAPVVLAPPARLAPPRARPVPSRRQRATSWRLAGQRLAACVALAGVFAATFEVSGALRAGPASRGAQAGDARGLAAADALALTGRAGATATLGASSAAVLAASEPVMRVISRDADGGGLAQVSYVSRALHGPASFLVYLPPGYRAAAAQRLPVLYLLHGDDQLGDAWLQVGVTGTLDALINAGELHPLLGVILQGAPRTDNWRNDGAMGYESYVIEVQQLVDRMLPTIADRSGRGIIGFSMGGFGAMNIALGHLDRFSVVESWLGFFNNLSGELAADAPQFARLPLSAFVYGAASDTIADPSENAPFAAALRSAGASAESAVYPGGHDFATLHAHLRHMLLFAGHALSPSA